MRIEIEHHGTIALIRPLDMQAEEWCDEHLDPDRQSFGRAIVVEPRYLPDIVNGFRDAGGEIE